MSVALKKPVVGYQQGHGKPHLGPHTPAPTHMLALAWAAAAPAAQTPAETVTLSEAINALSLADASRDARSSLQALESEIPDDGCRTRREVLIAEAVDPLTTGARSAP